MVTPVQQHGLVAKILFQVREDIMEQSMVYEGYVKSEGIYQGEGRLLFKNGNCHAISCDGMKIVNLLGLVKVEKLQKDPTCNILFENLGVPRYQI